METHEGKINLADTEIAYTSFGKGKPVIVLGGPWFGQRYIRPVAELIAEEFHAITYDPRGSGMSSPITADQITLAAHLKDLEGLRESLNIKQISLVGHSFGALVCLLYAAQYPDTTASLILAHAAPPFDPELREILHHAFVNGHTSEDRKRMMEIESSPGFLSRDAKTMEEYFKVLYASFFKDRRYLAQLDFGFTPTTAQYVLEAEERLIPQLLEEDPAGKLDKIKSPALVVHAERDLIPEAFSRFLAAGIRGAAYARLEDVGHFAYLENPQLFKSKVIPFLRKHAR
jgi:proline iminopeptidase